MAVGMVEALNARWTHAEELAAQLVERIDVLLRVTIQANSSKRVQFGPAFHYPRPGEDRRKRSVSPAALARKLGEVTRGV